MNAHIVRIECEKECKIILNGEEMEEVNEFKYLGSVMFKNSGTEGEIDGGEEEIGGGQ